MQSLRRFISISVQLFTFILHGQTSSGTLTISHLTGDYYIFSTYKSFNGTPISANGMYLVTNDGVAMFDTPWDTTQFQVLLDSIELKHNKKVVFCIATHSHDDRSAGLEFYAKKGIKTYSTKLTDEISKTNNGRRAQFLIDNDTVFRVGQYLFQTYYGGEGHTKDNIVLWFPDEKILYGGCLIKSTEAIDLGYIKEANLEQWPATIKKIQMKFGKPQYVIPGCKSWKAIQS
jgi:metallo-beta-lactamase class B